VAAQKMREAWQVAHRNELLHKVEIVSNKLKIFFSIFFSEKKKEKKNRCDSNRVI
jgi:hypothetical protein